MKYVYLCGPIMGLSYASATTWRRAAAHALALYGVHALDPMRGKEELRAIDGAITARTTPQHGKYTSRAIVERDANDIRRASVVLARLDTPHTQPSIGSVAELAWAYMLRIPVVAVLPPDESSPYHHPFIREFVGFPHSTMEQALRCVVHIIGEHMGDR
jgi:nucleoside 2-deoxyribosyltransferase